MLNQKMVKFYGVKQPKKGDSKYPEMEKKL